MSEQIMWSWAKKNNIDKHKIYSYNVIDYIYNRIIYMYNDTV